jgi:hypothetical protein
MKITWDLTIQHDITGNLYIYSYDEQKLKNFCSLINKSKGSVYYNKKYKCFAIRIKNAKHKKMAFIAVNSD